MESNEGAFSGWAFSAASKMRKSVGIGAVLASAFCIRELHPERWSGKTQDQLNELLRTTTGPRANLHYLQAATCLLLAILTPRPSTAVLDRPNRKRGTADQDQSIATEACRRIQLCLIATFLTWAAYYLASAMLLTTEFDPLDRLYQQRMLVKTAISTTFNLLPSVPLFWLYTELARITVERPPQSPPPSASASAAAAAARTPVLVSEAAYGRMISVGLFGLVVSATWIAVGLDNKSSMGNIEVIASCLNGVALALVVGRLACFRIDPGSLTLGLLFFYAVIQPAAAAFEQNPLCHLIATTIALPLKVLLWLVCVWAFTTGVMADYVREIRELVTASSAAKEPEPTLFVLDAAAPEGDE